MANQTSFNVKKKYVMSHLKVKFSLLTLNWYKNDVRFGVYMHELCVNVNWKILGSESEGSGMTSMK